MYSLGRLNGGASTRTLRVRTHPWGTGRRRRQHRRTKRKRGMEKWKAQNASHFPTPPTATAAGSYPPLTASDWAWAVDIPSLPGVVLCLSRLPLERVLSSLRRVPGTLHGQVFVRGVERRRSGLRSFPRRCPSTPACSGSAPLPVASARGPHGQVFVGGLELGVLLLKLFQPPRLVHLQPAEFLAPAIVGLLRDRRLFAGQSGRLPVGHAHFDLPQQTHGLLRRVLLPS